MPPELSIRPARPDDAAALAHLHVAVWRAVYRDLAPQTAYRALDAAVRLEHWRGILGRGILAQGIQGQETLAQGGQKEDAGRWTTRVLEEGDRLVGLGLAGPSAHPAFGGRGEIKHLYIDPAYHRRGLGRRLLAALAHRMAARGFTALALGVVSENHRAIAFYHTLGGRDIGHYTDPGPLWRSDNRVIAWDDLTPLLDDGDHPLI